MQTKRTSRFPRYSFVVLFVLANIFNLIIAHVEKPFHQTRENVFFESWRGPPDGFKLPRWPKELKAYEKTPTIGINGEWLFFTRIHIGVSIPPDAELIVLTEEHQDILDRIGWIDVGLSLSEYRYGAPFATRREYSAFVTVVGLDSKRAWPDPEDEDRKHIEYGFAGLILNPIIYALPVWLLLMTPRWAFIAIRSSKRSRRGLCTTCGYDFAGLNVCPECGNAPTA